jgi:hypothetical protein
LIAVPTGVVAFDESSTRTKARTSAKSYIPTKPDKYTLHWYTQVCWRSLYTQSFWDNGSGNQTLTNPANNFCAIFPKMAHPLSRTLKDHPELKQSLASALWATILTHLQLKAPSTRGAYHLIVMSNYYTRHSLVQAISTMSNKSIRILGTMQFNSVDSINRVHLKKAIEDIRESKRGTWKLVRAYDKSANWDKRQKDYNAQHPEHLKADKCGYMVLKDSKVVVFYTNDLAGTPPEPISDASNAKTVACVHGLASLFRWTGQEILSRREFQVPTIIIAYNVFRNGVDRMDQIRSTNPVKQKEMHVRFIVLRVALCVSF